MMKTLLDQHSALTAISATALLGACANGPLNYADDEPVVPIVTTVGTVPATTGTVRNYDPYGGAYDRYGARTASNPVLDGPRTTPGYTPVAAAATNSYGIDAARAAHRQYSESYAEQMDGQCESVVRVGYGETLSDIAEYCDTTVLALMQANNVRNPHNLRVGQTLTVPAVRGNVYDGTRFASIPRQPVYTDYRTQAPAPAGGDVYIVRRGDTMSEIANIYGVSTARLARLNRHLNPSSLRPGDRVILPANVDTPYYAERRDPAPLNPPIRSSHTNSAPVVIYIGDDPAGRAGTYAQEGKAVIVVDSDNRRAAPARDRIRTTRYVPNTVDRHTVIEQPAIPSGTVLTLRTKLPETQSSQYADLGTACMRFRDGQREVYRVQVTAAGPECGSDRPVRLYKPGL